MHVTVTAVAVGMAVIAVTTACKKNNNKNVVKKWCTDCKCQDYMADKQGVSNCPGKCAKPNWQGDGNCDDENNNCGCDYDGGDCCENATRGAVNKKYCNLCQCKDPPKQ